MNVTKPLDEPVQAVLKPNQRLPPEQRPRTRWVSEEARDVEVAGSGSADRGARYTEPSGEVRELSERGRPSTYEMNGRGRGITRSEQLDQGDYTARDVIDVREVECVIEPIDSQLLPERCSTGEGRDYPVGVVGRRAEHVRQADRAGTDADALCLRDEQLALRLGASVDIHRAQRGIFGGRERFRLPVDLAAAGEDQPRHARGLRRSLEHIAQTADVGCPAEFGVPLAPDDARNRC